MDEPLLFGAFVGNDDRSVERAEAGIGRPLTIHHLYKTWNQPLVGPLEEWSIAQGRTLFLNLKAVLGSADGLIEYVRWRSIANGNRDEEIRTKARVLKSLGVSVYLAFHHEPEDERTIDEDSPRCGSFKNYRNAWRRVVEVFREEGATNVSFVWCLLGSTFAKGEADFWYPGDDVVDIVSADAYNWFGTDEGRVSLVWRSFAEAFQAAYAWATGRRKPFWVGETGTLEDPKDPGRKAQWYLGMGEQAKLWPNLRALVYFKGGIYGWHPDSSPKALAAFKQVVNDPYFGGTV
jgi:hypothetical protein